MQGEAARGWDPDPQRAPAPPVTTRRVHSDAPDPGATSGRLPPFRASSMGSPRLHIPDGRVPITDAQSEVTADVAVEPIADILLESVDIMPTSTAEAPLEPTGDAGFDPATDLLHDLETQSEPAPAAGAHEAERGEWTEHATRADIEPAWLLDDVVDTDDAETEFDPVEPWTTPDAAGLEPESVDADEVGAVLDVEPVTASAPDEAEDSWDALGEALREAVTRADPPFAEDLVREAERNDRAPTEEPREMPAAPASLLQRREVGMSDADIPAALDRSNAPKPPADRFTEGLAATLEALAGGLRARGFNALDDAFARGDRLESSLALFLAGYRAGRGE